MAQLDRDRRLLSSTRQEDARSEFQRDRDRILYSAQFRRLSGVTQVTSPAELHSFHNRLTHTLEVAQIARRIAERLLKLSVVSPSELDPDVCEAAALTHDLGHPPFGHNGEKTLDAAARGRDPECVLPITDDDGYEGNAQSLRIVTKLAVRPSGPDRPVPTI
ncbi:dNTP triphosphohydrolase [bacterium]|nr:MAG: dNTP triphosphohydrolase [bacterium]